MTRSMSVGSDATPWRWTHRPLDRPACHTGWEAIPIAETWQTAITASPVVAMAVWQADRCALCGGWNQVADLVLDHCHANGMARGFLCRSCNAREPHAGRTALVSPHQTEAFAAYRKHPPAQILGLSIVYADCARWRNEYRVYETKQRSEIARLIDVKEHEITNHHNGALSKTAAP